MIQIVEGTIGYNEPLLRIPKLDIHAGMFMALIGKNGSGKSTFLKTLCGLVPIWSGIFKVNGRLLSELSPEELSKCIAFSGSTQPLVPYITVKEYVLLGRIPHVGPLGRYRDTDHSIANEVIEWFNISHLKDRQLSFLSDGERQLASFARAFSQETPIIILDEPTAFLDYGNKRALVEVLKEAIIRASKCVIMSTHDVDLCIEEKIPLLGIQSNDRLLRLFSKEIDREEILRTVFPKS